MDDPIVSRRAMFMRGYNARYDREPIDGHGMNQQSDAIAEWQAGWRAATANIRDNDALAKERAARTHHAIAAIKRLDAHQVRP